MNISEYLTEDYGRSIQVEGLIMCGLNKIDHFSDLSDYIRNLNYPNEYQCFFNEATYEKVINLLQEFTDSLNEKIKKKITYNIKYFQHYGIRYVIKKNYVNDLNIIIPLNLILVTPENSILIT